MIDQNRSILPSCTKNAQCQLAPCCCGNFSGTAVRRVTNISGVTRTLRREQVGNFLNKYCEEWSHLSCIISGVFRAAKKTQLFTIT
jgi:hypothetical protein